MKKNIKIHSIVLSFLILCFTYTSNLFAKENEPIIVAHVAPTTGRFSSHAEADIRGVKMAIEEFNRKGGVLGRQIVLISQNPTLDPIVATKVAQELITENKVGFMVGAVDSGVAKSISEVCQKFGVIFINTNSSSPAQSVEDAHRVKFVFDANAANYNHSLLQYALKKSKAKKVVLLIEDNAWGRSSADASKPYIKQYGGNIVKEILVPQSMPNPTTLIQEIENLKADVVAVNISGANQVKLFAQINPKTFDKQSWVIGEVDWEDLYLAPGNIRPLFGVNWSWNLNTAGTNEFVKKYRKKYKNTKLDYPGHVTYSAYLATKALLNAIVTTGTTQNHAVIKELEQYKASGKERMQNANAFMDPKSHHLQQSTYIATWRPNTKNPEKSIIILGHISPKDSRYSKEDTTQLESFEQTPEYIP